MYNKLKKLLALTLALCIVIGTMPETLAHYLPVADYEVLDPTNDDKVVGTSDQQVIDDTTEAENAALLDSENTVLGTGLPPVVVTEIDPQNVSQSGVLPNIVVTDSVFEAFELYNTTDSPINITQSYDFKYIYGTKSKTATIGNINGAIGNGISGEVIIPAKTAIEVWSYHNNYATEPGVKDLTVADFKNYYAALGRTDKNYTVVGCNDILGWNKTADRGICILSKGTTNVVSQSVYTGRSSMADKGVDFRYMGNNALSMSDENGTVITTAGNGTTPSIAQVRYFQKPAASSDTTAPNLTDSSPSTVAKDSDYTFNFALTDNTDLRYTALYIKPSNATAYVKKSDKDFVKDAGEKTSDTLSANFTYTLSAADIAGCDYFDYYTEVVDASGNTTQIPSSTVPKRVTVAKPADTTAPTVTITSPTNGQKFDLKFDGALNATLSDESGINAESGTISIDGAAPIKIPATNITDTSLTYSFASSPLSIGNHTITVSVSDTASVPNAGSATVTFIVESPTSAMAVDTSAGFVSLNKAGDFSADVYDTAASSSAKLYYRRIGSQDYASVDMTVKSNDAAGSLTKTSFAVSVPYNTLNTLGKVEYYIEIGGGKFKTPVKTATVQKTADIVFTDVVANSINVGSQDGYDYVQLINTSNKPIDLKNYKLAYRRNTSAWLNVGLMGFNNITKYPKAENQTEPDSIIVKPGEIYVLWVKITTSSTAPLTRSNFASAYGNTIDVDHILVAEHATTGNPVNPGDNFYLVNVTAKTETNSMWIVPGTSTSSNYEQQAIAKLQFSGDQVANENTAAKLWYDSNLGYSNSFAGLKKLTPGYLNQWKQIETDYSDYSAPVFGEFTPQASIDRTTDTSTPFTLTVNVSDDKDLRAGRLYYRSIGDSTYKMLESDYVEARDGKGTTLNSSITFTIPETDIITTGRLQYYFEALDAGGNISTLPADKNKPFETKVLLKPSAFEMPEIIITEVEPNPSGTDVFEFVEIYNTTDHDIDMTNYQLRIANSFENNTWYTNNWAWESTASKMLGAKEMMTIFLYNADAYNAGYKWATDEDKSNTWEEFQTFYTSSIPVDNRVLAPAFSDTTGAAISGANNLTNGAGVKAVQIVKKVNGNIDVVSQAKYTATDSSSTSQVVNGFSINYITFPGCDPINNYDALMIDYKAIPSPNGLLDVQKMSDSDDTTPVVTMQEPTQYRQPDETTFTVTAQDNNIRYAALFYKMDTDTMYKTVMMTKVDGTNDYTCDVPASDLKKSKNIRYFYVVSDGINYATAPYVAFDPYYQLVDDTEGPRVTSFKPDGLFEGEYSGYVEVNYTDNAGVDKSSIKFIFDGKDVTSKCIISESQLKYKVDISEIRRYDMTLTIGDKFGGLVGSTYPKQNIATHNLSFTLTPVGVNLEPTKGIIHAPMKSTVNTQDMTVAAVVTGSDDAPSLFYGLDDEAPHNRVAMSLDNIRKGDNAKFYKGVIPSGALKNATKVKYYITAGEMRAPTSEGTVYETKIFPKSPTPELMITEAFVNPEGLDDHEYVEVYNTSDKVLNLKDYKLMYQGYVKTNPNDIRENIITDDCYLDPGEVALVSFITTQAKAINLDVDMFKKKLGIQNSNVKVVQVYADSSEVKTQFNLNNTGIKLIMLAKANAHAGDYLCVATYNDQVNEGINDAMNGCTVNWGPPSDGTINLTKTDTGVKPTPGTINYKQKVLDYDDTLAPYLIHQNLETQGEDTKDITLKAKIFDENVLHYSSVFYRTWTTKGFVEKPLTPVEGEENTYSVTIPYKDVKYSNTLEYYFTATDGLHTVTLNSQSGQPFTVNFSDKQAPQITDYKPENYYYYEKSYTPNIDIKYKDDSGVDTRSVRLLVNNEDVTSNAKISDTGVTYTPNGPMPAGTYPIHFEVCDNSANKNKQVVDSQFTLGDGAQLNSYHGEMHSHTGFSDGKADPSVAFQYARDVGKLDFFAVTDHNDMTSPDELAQGIQMSKDIYNPGPGGFIAFYGIEMSWTGWYGHFNTFNVDWVENDQETTMRDYLDRLRESPGSFAQFNHPGVVWGDFLDYSYFTPENDDKVIMYENKRVQSDNGYYRALTKGWHLAVMTNEDNHSANWGIADPAVSVALAPALTKDNLIEAFRKSRTYITSNPSLSVDYRINNNEIGSRLKNPDALNFSIKASDAKGLALGSIKVYAEDVVQVYNQNFDTPTADVNFTLPAQYKYYNVSITTKTGQHLITSPIWVERQNAIEVSKMDLKLSPSADTPHRVITTLRNNTDNKMTNIKVTYYRGDDNGLTLTGDLPQYYQDLNQNGSSSVKLADPLAVMNVDGLDSKQTVDVTADIPEVQDKRRIYAVVSGEYNGKTYYDISYVLTSQLYITEMQVTSKEQQFSNFSLKDAFGFFEVYNNSHTDINLKGYKFNYWVSQGNTPTGYDIYTITGNLRLPAKTAKVIWVKDYKSKVAPSVTIDDFNKKYGTNLKPVDANGDGDVYVVYGTPLSTGSKRLDVANSSGFVISAVQYGFGPDVNGDNTVDRSIDFKYSVDGNNTCTSTKLDNMAFPSPGSVKPEQVPSDASDYSLKAIKVSYGNGSSNVSMSDLSTSYRFKVPEGAKAVAVTPEAVDASHKLRVNGVVQSSGQTSKEYTLSSTSGCTVLIEVLDENNNPAANYTVSIGTGELNTGSDTGTDNGAGTPGGGSSGDTGGADTGTGNGTGSGGDNNQSPTDKPNAEFTDVSGHWAETAIGYMSSKGIIKGYADGTFKPNDNVKRGDFILMLMRAFPSNTASTDSFADVPSDSYYYEAITQAKALGIATGYDGNKFDPNAEITREDMFVLYARALEKLGTIDKTKVSGSFADKDKIASYAVEAIDLLNGNGIISGSDNSIDPTGAATRAQVAQMLYNYFNSLVS
ncbi:MAG: lamin tail domain-containing protein [Bacillota bacterium]|nr:lamin tail domain-containing protein [Bacillota bacterium]